MVFFLLKLLMIAPELYRLVKEILDLVNGIRSPVQRRIYRLRARAYAEERLALGQKTVQVSGNLESLRVEIRHTLNNQ